MILEITNAILTNINMLTLLRMLVTLGVDFEVRESKGDRRIRIYNVDSDIYAHIAKGVQVAFDKRHKEE